MLRRVLLATIWRTRSIERAANSRWVWRATSDGFVLSPLGVLNGLRAMLGRDPWEIRARGSG